MQHDYSSCSRLNHHNHSQHHHRKRHYYRRHRCRHHHRRRQHQHHQQPATASNTFITAGILIENASTSGDDFSKNRCHTQQQIIHVRHSFILTASSLGAASASGVDPVAALSIQLPLLSPSDLHNGHRQRSCSVVLAVLAATKTNRRQHIGSVHSHNCYSTAGVLTGMPNRVLPQVM